MRGSLEGSRGGRTHVHCRDDHGDRATPLSGTQLAGEYGVHRTTVTKILQRHGVEPQRGMHPDLIDEAIRRYAESQSLAAVGRALGADPGTIRARLVERGVAMRDTHGRPR